MANYTEVKGTTIKKLSADPPAPIEGEIWFNSTSGVLKGYKNLPLSWSTGGSLNTARQNHGGVGTQTSALAFGGAPGFKTVTESYNGSSWTEVNALNTGKNGPGAAGTSTAALAFGGYGIAPGDDEYSEWPQPLTESWNGTNWTEVNDMNRAASYLPGAGETNTAALAFGGYPNHLGPTSPVALTESWNGTNWTEVNDMNLARIIHAGTGSSTAALSIGGGPVITARTESWNGTNWTEVNDLNTGRDHLNAEGTQTASIAFGGETGPTVPSDTGETESWNGTNWTVIPATLNTARGGLRGAGTSTAALAFGGQLGNGPGESVTEEFAGGAGPVTFDA